MQQNTAYNIFLDTLQKRFPDKKSLAKHLSTLLHIEKEAVYRRLRGTVAFSFAEITSIALHLNISLDSILALGNKNTKTLPLRLTLTNQWDPDETDYLMLERFTHDIKGLDKYTKSEYISIANTIPQIFYTQYEKITRFYFFKWQYEEGNSYTKIPYKDVYPTEQINRINKQYQKYCQTAHTNILILDKNTLRMLVDDILYFYNIQLITKEEVYSIWEDLKNFLNELEKITMNGQFENGKKIYLYITNISIKGSYTMISCNPNYKLCMTNWFIINDCIATDDITYQKMLKYTSSLQRTSILISESGEIQRIQFFEEQHKQISLLKKL